MSNVSKLFPSAPTGFEVRHEGQGWIIYLVYASGQSLEWLGAPDQSRVYQSLDDVLDFFGTAGIDKFTVRLGL